MLGGKRVLKDSSRFRSMWNEMQEIIKTLSPKSPCRHSSPIDCRLICRMKNLLKIILQYKVAIQKRWQVQPPKPVLGQEKEFKQKLTTTHSKNAKIRKRVFLENVCESNSIEWATKIQTNPGLSKIRTWKRNETWPMWWRIAFVQGTTSCFLLSMWVSTINHQMGQAEFGTKSSEEKGTIWHTDNLIWVKVNQCNAKKKTKHTHTNIGRTHSATKQSWWGRNINSWQGLTKRARTVSGWSI